jgi:hypothetical protein
MAMSKRSGGEKQEDIWIAHTELAVAPGHPFYQRLNELLDGVPTKNSALIDPIESTSLAV